jgi:hypothetical protein
MSSTGKSRSQSVLKASVSRNCSFTGFFLLFLFSLNSETTHSKQISIVMMNQPVSRADAETNESNTSLIDQTIVDTVNKLDQWRDDAHRSIDEYHRRKAEEIHDYIQKRKVVYNELLFELNLLRADEDTDRFDNNDDLPWLKLRIRVIESNLRMIAQNFSKIHVKPLNIDDSLISIDKFNMESIRLKSSFVTYCEHSSSAVSSNQRHLLCHRHPNLAVFDRSFFPVQQCAWPHGWIRDMCWSSRLQRFIVLTADKFYAVDEQLEIEPVEDTTERSWFSCTCSNEILYITTHELSSSVYGFRVDSLSELAVHWRSPDTCDKHEGINDIKYSNGKLGIMIVNYREHSKRMTLKSCSNFETIWSHDLNAANGPRLFTCCPLNNDEWLCVDGQSQCIHHMSSDGQIQGRVRYTDVPYRANLFDYDGFVVSTETCLNFHRLNFEERSNSHRSVQSVSILP